MEHRNGNRNRKKEDDVGEQMLRIWAAKIKNGIRVESALEWLQTDVQTIEEQES